MPKTAVQFREEAEFLRESSGSNIEKTLIKAVKVLALFQVPHYVCGGFAVQEHGYRRLTVDVDIIVPDVDFAREKLCMNGFRENVGSKTTVTDKDVNVEVSLLPGGSELPMQVSDKQQIQPLQSLISSELSTYMDRGIKRAQDYADVVELIQANSLPLEFAVPPGVLELYQQKWDALHAS